MKKRKVSKEKVFIAINVLVIFIIIFIYLYRAVYYYKKTNYVPESKDLYSNIVNLKNIVSSGDGLYQSDEDVYYFKGNKVNNYVKYSDMIWRIIEINDKGIKLISDEIQTSLVYGINHKFENSYVFSWLNSDKFINGLYNIDEYIVTNDWCNEGVDVSNYSCAATVNSLVGLLSINEYVRAGGKDSYLNTNSYWWTINTSKENNPYFINDLGEISDQNKNLETYYSYGVRPVININRDILFLSGYGTKENPYILDNNIDIEINNHSLGTYVSYNGYNFRIMEIGEEYTKLILEDYLLDDNKNPVKLSYDKVDEYLENNFIAKFNKEDLVKLDYYYGNYDLSNNYKLSFENKTNSYVGLPTIGDMHITDYPNVWLNNELSNSEKLDYVSAKDEKLNYVSKINGRIFADLATSENYIRPVISLKLGLIISGGEGTKNNPLVIGELK